MDTTEQHKIANAMMKYGGNFVKCLGHALAYADAENAQRMKNGFPELIYKYQKMAEEDEGK